jgi:hypothetical protein
MDMKGRVVDWKSVGRGRGHEFENSVSAWRMARS